MTQFAGENPVFQKMMRDFQELQAKQKARSQENINKMKEQTYRDVMATQGVIIPFV